MNLSPDTQAALLLTAPLLLGGATSDAQPLTPGEAKRLVRMLAGDGDTLSALLTPDSPAVGRAASVVSADRLRILLQRGFLLSQAIEAWQTRAIWVLGRTDAGYPVRLVERLGEDAPPVLYGCGDPGLLQGGGLAVVGSRKVDGALMEYTRGVGALAACARVTVVSGGARGIDQAAMSGALADDGSAIGVLADSLARAAIVREHRDAILDERLTLVSPYDPAAGFNVGNAMQRNKLIYAMSDAALVMCCDTGVGGTWAGAVEQLGKLRLVPVWVRPDRSSAGLLALQQKGALTWPEPKGPEALAEVLRSAQAAFAEAGGDEPATAATCAMDHGARLRETLGARGLARTEVEIAADLSLPSAEVKALLRRLVADGSLEKLVRPVRYRIRTYAPTLFDPDGL